MKKFSWIKALLLPCITCGIYNLYMWHVMTKNSNKMAEEKGVNKIMGFIPALLLGCITFGIYTLVWNFKFQKQQIAIAEACGIKTKPTQSAFLLFILMIVPIYSYIVLCGNYNNNVDAVGL